LNSFFMIGSVYLKWRESATEFRESGFFAEFNGGGGQPMNFRKRVSQRFLLFVSRQQNDLNLTQRHKGSKLR